MHTLVVTGTGTQVGKTAVTAAVAALARARGRRVAAVKPTQTGALPGEDGDLKAIRSLSGVEDLHEHARFRAPLAPAAAARHEGRPPVDLHACADDIRRLARSAELVLVEGAGGLLVRYDERGTTIADLARRLAAPVLVVAPAGLGTLNATALTLEALARRKLDHAGVVVGAWPTEPDLAARSNVEDLQTISGAPLAGALQEGAGSLDPTAFLAVARAGLAPALGGSFRPDRLGRTIPASPDG